MRMSSSSIFVLLHGGRHGGWCWVRVARILRSRGHEVLTPTLTGLGERSHLLGKEIGLSTHIEDLVRVFAFNDLSDVVLVAHSYGGVVGSGAMERIYDRVRRLAFLDAHMPESGQSVFDIIGPDRAGEMTTMASEEGEGWFIPASDASHWGITDTADRAWVNTKVTAQPLRTYVDRLGSTDRARIHPSMFIECTRSSLPAAELEWQRSRSLNDSVHQFRRLNAPHDSMVTHPREVATLLLEAAELD